MKSLYIECKTTLDLKQDGLASAILENWIYGFGIIGKIIQTGLHYP